MLVGWRVEISFCYLVFLLLLLSFMGRSEISKEKKVTYAYCMSLTAWISIWSPFVFLFFFLQLFFETLIVVVSVVVMAYGYSFFAFKLWPPLLLSLSSGHKNIVKIKTKQNWKYHICEIVNVKSAKYILKRNYFDCGFRIYLKYELSTNEQINKNTIHKSLISIDWLIVEFHINQWHQK